MTGGLLVAGVLFGVAVHFLDRTSVPAWKGKYVYRLLTFICWLGWVATMLKALEYRTELRTLIPFCR